MTRRPRAAILLCVFVAASGCVATESANPAALEGNGAGAGFDDSTGAILVTVLDEELMPIANATVGVRSETADEGNASSIQQTIADAQGRATFSNLEPATYQVFVAALGFDADSKSKDVAAGEVAEVRFQLTLAPVDGPYHETISERGIVQSVLWRIGPSCDTVVQPPLGTCLGIQFSDVTFYRVLAEDWVTIVDEATWIPNSAASHQRAYVFATFPNVTDFSGVPDFESPGHFEAAGPNPVILRIERSDIRARNFPEESQYGEGPDGRGTRFRAVNDFEDLGVPGVVGVSLMWEQAMTVYNTEFHDEPAPATFSALPDA